MGGSTEKDIALAEIRRRKAKLERLEKLFLEVDADDLALLRSLLPREQAEAETAKGMAEQEVQAPKAKPAVECPSVQPSMVIQKPQRLRHGGVRRGLLDRQVRNAAAQLKKGISVHTVFGVLDKTHFRFGAKNPKRAIGSVLCKLQKKGLIHEVVAGSGRRPAEYEIKTELDEGTNIRTLKTP
ncbi:MAG: hypothetical protein AAB403_14605 [Planctomycetota bacterium]